MDLISLSRALTALPGITPAQQAQIPSLISAASDAAERFCNRHFFLTSYDEVYNADSTGSFILKNFPVVSIERMASGLTTAIAITNTKPTPVYRATVNLNASTTSTPLSVTVTTFGDSSSFYPASAIEGMSTVSSVGLNSATFLLPPATTANRTLYLLADSINSYGNGWRAEVSGRFVNWPTTDLRPLQGSANAFGTPASLKVYSNDVGGYYVDQDTGEVRFQSGNYWMPTMYGETSPAWPDSPFVYGFHSLRVQYTAGFTTVPEAVQQAVVLIVQDMFISTNVYNGYKKEKLFDYEYELAEYAKSAIPADAQKLLWLYRDFRATGEY